MADYDVTYSFSVQAEANDEWILGSDVTGGGGSDHEAQAADNNNGGWWCWTDTGSPSGSTGPPSGVPCIYTETSTTGTGQPAAGDQFTCTLRTPLDAGQYGFYVTFDTCMYGDTTGVAYFEAFDGNNWNIIDTFNGDSTTTFTARGPYDLTSYSNSDFQIRFRTVCGTGNIYQNDFSWDEVRIYGDLKQTYKLEGVTKDKSGNILGSCKCFLFKDNLDDTLTFVDYVLSDSVTGAYSFTGISDNDAQYLVVAWKDDTPHVFDVTDHVLQPVVE